MQLTLPDSNRKLILRWLKFCLALVALMVIVGGLTRLTESGLSMVEWKPTTILPPLNETEWAEEFAKYQQSPEYQKVNKGFGVEGFKQIFWLEYIHRLLGRMVGFAFFLPFAYFLAKRMIPSPLAWRLTGIFLLGGMQGVIGWVMVKSGLQDQPWVSPVKLAMHLGMAFIIFGLLWWVILNLQYKPSFQRKLSRSAAETGEAKSSTREIPAFAGMTAVWGWIFLLILLYLQILLGALVAGMDAGLLFNTFPDMAGEWVPNGIWLLEPWYLNLAENGTTVHFLHRLGAVLVTLGVIALSAKDRSWAIFSALMLQILLGAATVMYSVPILIASAHQVVALLLFALVLKRVFTAHPQ